MARLDSDSSLRVYLREISKTDLLTPKEEVELAARIKKGDKKARAHMIKANLRLFVKIAQDYSNYGLPLADLISEGNIGLMKAVERFDPEKGGKLSTYAAWWIRHRVSRALVNHGSAVRVPNHIAQTSSKLLKKARELERTHGRAATVEELAAATDLPVKKVRLALQTTGRVLSLDGNASDEERSLLATLADDTESSFDELEGRRTREAVSRVLESLDPVEADVLRKRFAFDVEEPLTLRDIGAMHSLTRERIRQIQNTALAKMRRELDEFRAA